ncbi:MAG: hypothetical protein ABSD73_12695, partial [Candidatus Bathyarchaeia archaeon]
GRGRDYSRLIYEEARLFANATEQFVERGQADFRQLRIGDCGAMRGYGEISYASSATRILPLWSE